MFVNTIKLKIFFEFIKNNISVILLLPAILGGFWQIIELSKMSISYIRFFSATQLLPDGLLVLFIFSMILLAIKLGSLEKLPSLQKKILKITVEKPSTLGSIYIEPYKNNKLFLIDNPILKASKNNIIIRILMILLFIIIVSSVYFVMNNIEPFKSEKFNFATYLVSLSALLLIFRPFIQSIYILLYIFVQSNFCKKYIGKIPSFILELLLVPIVSSGVVLIITIPILIFKFFHINYTLPDNLKNLEFIEKKLSNKDFDSNQITYLNDKFIFIEHLNKDGNSTIEILKFDELFSQ